MVSVAPTDARMIEPMASHCISVRLSCRKSNPDNAPNAGSILVRVLKVRAGNRVSAIGYGADVIMLVNIVGTQLG